MADSRNSNSISTAVGINLNTKTQERDVADSGFETVADFSGRTLRELRRSRGLNQMQLAELLGVTQPNISRWEAGFERTPRRICERLKDVLTGKEAKSGEYYFRLAKSDPNTSSVLLHQYSLPLVHLSQYASSMLSQEPSYYIGKDYRRIFRTEWLDEVFQGRSISDYALVTVHHELIPDEPSPNIPAVRACSDLYVLHPDEGTPMVLAKAHYSKSTGEPPRITHAIPLDAL